MRNSKKKEQPKQLPKRKGRRTRNGALTGATGTGKSTKGKEIGKKLFNPKTSKCLVITFNGSGETWDDIRETQPTKKGLSFKRGWRKIIWARWKEFKEVVILKEIFNHYRNGGIIFDDCKMYMRPNIEHTPYLAQVCCDHRHNGYDMIFIAHTPKQIPVDVWSYIDFHWIYRCKRKYKESDLDCENADLILKYQKEVNKKCIALERQGKPIWGIYECVRL